MRTIVHLSDLHFGREDDALLSPLIETVAKIKPNLVAISGDLTQRARTAQFAAARRFLVALPSPQIVVPGNHDVPLHNLYKRMVKPLANYCAYISPDLEPYYEDEEIAVLGINTARSLTIKGGRISAQQLRGVRSRFHRLPEDILKILVTHHPFDLPAGGDKKDIIGRARVAISAFAKCGVDILISGHLHLSHTASTAARYKVSGPAALIVQAGTATSTRGRGEPNTFNVLRLAKPIVEIERYAWDESLGEFGISKTERFEQRAGHWVPLAMP